MDNTKNADEQMEEIRTALQDIRFEDSVTNSDVASEYDFSQTYNNTGLYSNSTVVGGGYTLGNLTSNATPYFTAGAGVNWGTGTTSITANPWITTSTAGRMELNGDNADVVINGVSIMEILKDRLNVMIPNPVLEKEWDQLKELGDQYRALEAKLKEQGEMWTKLKAMPLPDLL